MDFGSGRNVALGGSPKAAEDEEYDLLNDETFGDIQEDFDWDEATRDVEDLSREEDGGSTKLESRVNDLMVDDAPDDPAIITLHAHRIPRAKNEQDKLNDLYGPQSPPAYVSSIGGFLNPSQDIWGSPVSTGAFPGLGSAQAKRLGDKQDSLRDAYESNGGFPTPPSPPRLELDRQNLDASPAMPAGAMTVEELERQLGSAPVSIPASNRTPPTTQSRPGLIPTHPGSPYHQHMLAAAAAAQSSGGTPPRHNMGYGMASMPQVIPRMQFAPRPNGTPPGFPHQNMDPRFHQQRPNVRPITILQRPDQQGAHDPSMYRGMPGQGGTPPQGQSMYNGGGNPHMPPPPHMRMRMPGPAPVRFPPGVIPHPHHMHHQRHPGMMHPHRMNMGPYHHGPPPAPHGPPRDEYSGLLTNREKEWLVKIQMIQLHTEDPYTDDYYYTIYNLEKNELDGDSRRSSVGELILPAHAKIETRQYKPMQFEGSLGRLTSSSVHKPRQVLDVKGKEDQIPHTIMETKKYRQTLLMTEKAFQIILDMDEIKKKVPSVPVEQRSEMEDNYKTKLHSLHQLVEENWSTLFNVRKGRSLILRTLPLIDKDSGKHLLHRMISSPHLLLKKELADPVDMKASRCVDTVLSQCDMQTLLSFTELLSSYLGSLIKSLFGCYLVLMMIKQAEKIYSAFVDVTEEQSQSWNSFVDSFLRFLSKLETLPKLKAIPMSVYDHLTKRSGSDQVLEKVDVWFKKSV